MTKLDTNFCTGKRSTGWQASPALVETPAICTSVAVHVPPFVLQVHLNRKAPFRNAVNLWCDEIRALPQFSPQKCGGSSVG